MQNRRRLYFVSICVIMFSGLLLACQQPADITPGGDSTDSTTATITIAIGDALASYGFTTANAAAEIASIDLTVTGEGMETISQPIDPASPSLELSVPQGSARSFVVDIAVKPTSPYAAAEIEGTATVDVEAGVSQTVTASFSITKTKILMPDAVNGTVVMMADLGGSGLQTKDLSLDGISPAVPYDVEVDAQGKIYVSTYDTTVAPVGSIVRYDTMADSTPELLAGGSLAGGSADTPGTAIDLKNGYLYHIKNASAGYWTLRRFALSDPLGSDTEVVGSSETEFPFTGSTGVAVDNQGYVYIYDNGSTTLTKFDPNGTVGARKLASHTYAELGITRLTLWDLMVVGDKLYATVGSISPQILRVDTDLSPASVVTYGSTPQDPQNPQAGEFFAPERFAGGITGKIIVADEMEGNASVNRLIGFDDMSGSNWQVYAGSYPFDFFIPGSVGAQ